MEKITKNSDTQMNLPEKQPEKEMVGHYFDVDLLNEIADFIYMNKKHLPVGRRKKLNRSNLINLIIKEVFADYQKFGNSSLLGKIFSKWSKE